MIQAYKNLRYFIYLNVKAQYRSEGYRLVNKLLDEATELGQQRKMLDERLNLSEAGIPALDTKASM